MPRYLVERTFTDGAHIPIGQLGAKTCAAVVDANSQHGVTGVHSCPDHRGHQSERPFVKLGGVTMNHIRRAAVAFAGAAISLIGLIVVTSAAFAAEVAPRDWSGPVSTSSGHGSGMAGWEIALIAVASALVASALTVTVQRFQSRQVMHAATA